MFTTDHRFPSIFSSLHSLRTAHSITIFRELSHALNVHHSAESSSELAHPWNRTVQAKPGDRTGINTPTQPLCHVATRHLPLKV
ncbi:hypothetical protein ACOMHN_051510 [Nucella lapillus]